MSKNDSVLTDEEIAMIPLWAIAEQVFQNVILPTKKDARVAHLAHEEVWIFTAKKQARWEPIFDILEDSYVLAEVYDDYVWLFIDTFHRDRHAVELLSSRYPVTHIIYQFKKKHFMSPRTKDTFKNEPMENAVDVSSGSDSTERGNPPAPTVAETFEQPSDYGIGNSPR